MVANAEDKLFEFATTIWWRSSARA